MELASDLARTLRLMVPDLMKLIEMMSFEHEWLSEKFVAESQQLAVNEKGRKHHYVPQMYLRRWALDGKVQPTQVNTRQVHRPQPPKEVAYQNNFYSLPPADSSMDLPLKWLETHLGRIESDCADRLDELEAWGSGLVSDDALKRDLSVFLGLQVTRTPSNRQRSLLLVNGPDAAKRIFLRKMNPRLSIAEIEQSMRNRHADPKQEVLDLMIKDVRNVIADSLYQREWALFRTASPVITCDDPVIFVSGPPLTRKYSVGALMSAVVLYPVNPYRVLVMLRPGLRHRGPYRLANSETHSINTELVGAAAKTTFERPGDGIAAHIAVPPRPPQIELDDEKVKRLDTEAALHLLLRAVSPRSRWADVESAPAWPVPRWYSG